MFGFALLVGLPTCRKAGCERDHFIESQSWSCDLHNQSANFLRGRQSYVKDFFVLFLVCLNERAAAESVASLLTATAVVTGPEKFCLDCWSISQLLLRKLRSEVWKKLPYRRFKVDKSRQLFIRTHNETLSIVVVRHFTPSDLRNDRRAMCLYGTADNASSTDFSSA